MSLSSMIVAAAAATSAATAAAATAMSLSQIAFRWFSISSIGGATTFGMY